MAYLTLRDVFRLYGITTLQAFMYYRRNQKDSRALKLSVSAAHPFSRLLPREGRGGVESRCPCERDAANLNRDTISVDAVGVLNAKCSLAQLGGG